MNKQGLEKNIVKYYVLRCLVKRMVWPILTLYLLRNQLTVDQIGTIVAVCTIAGILFEVPSGAFADWFGRRRTMALSMFIAAVSMFVLWRMTGFWSALVGQLIYTFSGSFWSGTHDAFIFETLRDLGREKELKKVAGRALFYSQTITGVLFVLVPWLATYSLSFPFFLNGFVFIGAGLFCLSLVEPRTDDAHSVLEQEPDALGFKMFFRNSALIAAGLAFGLIGGINGILESFRQVYLDAVQFDLQYFGFVYLMLRLLTGFAGDRVDALERKIGRTAMLLLVPICSLIAYVGLASASGYWWLVFIAFDGLMGGFSRPLEQEFLNRAITKSRATMLSIYNAIEDVIGAGFVFVAGFIIAWYGVRAGFAFAALATIVFVTPAYMWFMRKDRAAFKAK